MRSDKSDGATRRAPRFASDFHGNRLERKVHECYPISLLRDLHFHLTQNASPFFADQRTLKIAVDKFFLFSLRFLTYYIYIYIFFIEVDACISEYFSRIFHNIANNTDTGGVTPGDPFRSNVTLSGI